MSDTINIYTKNRTKIFTAIFMFCLSFNVLGQKCTTSIKKGTDRFTNKVSYYLKNPIERILTNKKRIFIMDIIKDEAETLLLICYVTSPNFGCTGEGSKLHFIFDNDIRLECYNDKIKYSCDGSVFIYLSTKKEWLPHNNELLNNLSNLLVTAIRVESTTNSYEIDINKKEAEKFRASVKCIAE